MAEAAFVAWLILCRNLNALIVAIANRVVTAKVPKMERKIMMPIQRVYS